MGRSSRCTCYFVSNSDRQTKPDHHESYVKDLVGGLTNGSGEKWEKDMRDRVGTQISLNIGA